MEIRVATIGRWLIALLTVCMAEAGGEIAAAPPDPGPRTAREAARHFTLPPGFSATLFAGEPDVVQPIAGAFDDRGRLWVVECLSYPNWRQNGQPGQDRVVIFDDIDGDGRFDSRRVFFDRGADLSGIQFGFGGVWLCATPNLIFIPDRDGDDQPDGPPEILLDGWDLTAKHNVFAALEWGPDGWLYGCNGILSNSRVGKPGAADKDRTPLNCGVWRFQPLRREFEVVAHGTTNPWGLDFNEAGDLFITNCVIKHLWHIVPGAHFERMFGPDLNPNCYGLLSSCADHIHWGGGPWTDARGAKPEHDKPGGGHAHVGAMVYLGDNWPDEYRHDIYMCNVHGNRVNRDRLERRGSSYVAHHGADFLLANDPWFRGLWLRYGPDGGVFLADWCDTGECHDYEEIQRTNGRIYKIVFGQPRRERVDLARLSDAELVKLLSHKNEWFVRHARRLLQERAAAGKLAATTRPALLEMLNRERDVVGQLRATWALHASGGRPLHVEPTTTARRLETVNAWNIRLDADERVFDRPGNIFAEPQRVRKASGTERLAIAGAVSLAPLERRWPIVEELLSHGAADLDDPYLPLMTWYAVEPLVAIDTDRALALAAKSPAPLVRRYAARRAAGLSPAGLNAAVRAAGQSGDDAARLDVLAGVQDALEGLRDVPMPEAWPATREKFAAQASADVRDRAALLSLVFGDRKMLVELRRALGDVTAPVAARQKALAALVQHRDAGLPQILHGLLDDRAVRGPAIRALAAFDDAGTPGRLVARYAALADDEKRDAIATLSSRPKFAAVLIDALEAGKIPRADLPTFLVRQIMDFKDSALKERLTKTWGAIRPASEEKAAQLARYRSLLQAPSPRKVNPTNGRNVFVKSCAACHVLFNEGGKIGPELTGSQRTNLDYILENLLDPSAVVARDYQVTIVQTKDGRVLNGLIKQETASVLTLQTQNEVVALPLSDIAERQKSTRSMMPEGQLEQISIDDLRDLVEYLRGPSQVPRTRVDPRDRAKMTP